MLGHNNETVACKMAAYLGWTIKHGELQPRKDCVLVKAKQKNEPKEGTRMKATVPNGQVYMDNSMLKLPNGIAELKVVWNITIKEYSGVEVSGFFKNFLFELNDIKIVDTHF